MMKIFFEYQKTASIDQRAIEHHWHMLAKTLHDCSSARYMQEDSPYGFVRLPSDFKMQEKIQEVAHEKKVLNISLIIVIGMGGSCLASRALAQWVLSSSERDQLYFLDSIDAVVVARIQERAENILRAGGSIFVNLVSKSGNTLEVIANGVIFLELLKKYYKKEYTRYVVATTDRGSSLWQWAIDEGIICLETPHAVSGRYTAFSTVTLFPLAMSGVVIDELCAGAQSGLLLSLSQEIQENSAAIQAIITFIHLINGYALHDLFLFAEDLQGLGMWYRQLMAESLGKNKRALLPTVSIATADMHSMIQLYLDGSLKRYTTFIHVDKEESASSLESNSLLYKTMPLLDRLSHTKLMKLFFHVTKESYQKNEQPFSCFIFPDRAPFFIGQLMQIMMMEVVYVGTLLDIDPFNQPRVELYKQELQRLLRERTL